MSVRCIITISLNNSISYIITVSLINDSVSYLIIVSLVNNTSVSGIITVNLGSAMKLQLVHNTVEENQ